MTKYIFITGGVTSSLGKGIVAASLAKLLQATGLKITIQKFDPYLNIDPGTLNPYEHGECFVTNDGAETDLDLGHYERFLGIETSKANNITTGRVYQTVIENERQGKYLGKTVQIIPHITDEIKKRFCAVSDQFDIIITEIGGTVGDIESLPFIESIRQMRFELGQKNCICIHLTLIPYLSAAKELKTKPTQHSVKELLSLGIQPDILVCRTEKNLTQELKDKIALFCNVEPRAVVESIDADTIYQVPVLLNQQELDKIVLQKLDLPTPEINLPEWCNFLHKLQNPKSKTSIGLVGKYITLQDAYKSIFEAITHAGAELETQVDVRLIDPENFSLDEIDDLSGLIIAPGFGKRGIEGKIELARYGREAKIPTFGICLGMQVMAIEFARNVLGSEDANSTEFNPATLNPVIHLLTGQTSRMGGTMRLGVYECSLNKTSQMFKLYQSETIWERHRHRYEMNNQWISIFEEAGMSVVGRNPKMNLVEAIELKGHPWFIGVQYHPEYKSTPEKPHPLFLGFLKSCLATKTN